MMEFKTLMENLQLDSHIVDYSSLNHFSIYFVLQHSSETPGLTITCMIYKQQGGRRDHL